MSAAPSETQTDQFARPAALILAADSWEARLVRFARELRKRRKTSMLVLRFDGLAWQLLEASPTIRLDE